MRFRKQNTLSSCGPFSIYNFAKFYNKKININQLKKECRTDKDGTFTHYFEKTLKKYFKNIKRVHLTINQIKSLCNKHPLIVGYEYKLSGGDIEGHYSMIIGYKNNKFLLVNSFNLRDVNKIDYKTKSELIKTYQWISEKTFKEKLFCKIFYYLPKEL